MFESDRVNESRSVLLLRLRLHNQCFFGSLKLAKIKEQKQTLHWVSKDWEGQNSVGRNLQYSMILMMAKKNNNIKMSRKWGVHFGVPRSSVDRHDESERERREERETVTKTQQKRGAPRHSNIDGFDSVPPFLTAIFPCSVVKEIWRSSVFFWNFKVIFPSFFHLRHPVCTITQSNILPRFPVIPINSPKPRPKWLAES